MESRDLLAIFATAVGILFVMALAIHPPLALFVLGGAFLAACVFSFGALLIMFIGLMLG